MLQTLFKSTAAAANPLEQLISLMAKLPGLGPRSARRAALHLLKKRESALPALITALQTTLADVKTCKQCGNYDVTDPCHICTNPVRDAQTICVVEDVDDLWALERSRSFKGHYHILGGTLSALAGMGPEQLRVSQLLTRVAQSKAGAAPITEVILALGATVEGQTTAHYLAEKLQGMGVAVTRPAQGMPMGGELDYLDDGTLITALKARRPV